MQRKVLVANRGEIAVRVARAAHEWGAAVVGVHAADEADAPHLRVVDESVALPAAGPAAYLDAEALVGAARSRQCTHVHPGYGFLSEDARFAALCQQAGLVFVGPPPDVLDVFGDKVRTRELARSLGVAVLDATPPGASLAEVRAFLDAHPGGVVVKAQSAGGGRGLRVVRHEDELADAYARCVAEAQAASGQASVFAEELLGDARHIEVQVVGARHGDEIAVQAVGDRDCSVQRAMQKVVEVAPAPQLPDDVRLALHTAAVRLCASVRLTGLATVEFLVAPGRHVLLEVNPRLQVEHPVTEQVTGLDLVRVSFDVADGVQVERLGLPLGVTATSADEVSGTPGEVTRSSLECRLLAEEVVVGHVSAATGTVSVFLPPTGPGVRVDTHVRPGLVVTGQYDPLLAKVITTGDDVQVALERARRALDELVVDGVGTNVEVLRSVLASPDVADGVVTTTWLEEQLEPAPPQDARVEDGMVRAQLLGTVVSLAEPGAFVPAGRELAVLEAMKMQHAVVADRPVVVTDVLCSVGETVPAGHPLLAAEELPEAAEADKAGSDSPRERHDLAEVWRRHALTQDDARVERLSRIRERGRRTARENVADLVDPGTFVEYGALAVAAQRQRKSMDELIAETPADGMVAGVGRINGDEFAAADSVVLAYDYSVLAGTQGMVNHDKTDRVLELAQRRGLPVVLFAEGGGGRPGDTDRITTGLVVRTFRTFAELRGHVPLVAVVSGRCFAGNAAFAGTCDVIVATPDANLGMGGPAMIEGGGLGRVRPEEIGPVDVQTRNGVVDVVAADEAEAVAVVKKYLGYFQGRRADWKEPDAEQARQVVPENRLRSYDVRRALEALADVDSVLELRPEFGQGMVTALARFEGHPCLVLANDSRYLGGAIDAESAQKAREFLRLSTDFGLPVLALCDTPGFMVGPAAEEQASVRRFAELFAAGAQVHAPFGMVILRKCYGLGGMAMAMGHLQAPVFTVAWPTGELGPMGLEGAVQLGFRRELEAKTDPGERRELYESLVAMAYEHGKALNAATLNEIDDVIDPAETRRWIRQLFSAA